MTLTVKISTFSSGSMRNEGTLTRIQGTYKKVGTIHHRVRSLFEK